MIKLTRRNHDLIVVNLSTIAYVEATPDTLITLVTGERLHVRESVDEVMERTRAWQRTVFASGLAIAGAVPS